MGRNKNRYHADFPLVKPPVIYINDSGDGCYGSKVAALIPLTLQLVLSESWKPNNETLTLALANTNEHPVVIISDKRGEEADYLKLNTIQFFREAAIKDGRNFVSINIVTVSAVAPFYTAHLGPSYFDIAAPGRFIAENIYRWLFSVLSVKETLFLIPEEQMRETDTENFADYKYCPISESRNQPKDAKVQFVALILDKPQVGPGQRLTWAVADRTGVATFYFQYRGPQSQYTWDWVLSMKPGDRRALPRMPMIEIKEKKRVSIIKAPFRATSVVVGGAGRMVQGIGHALTRISERVKLGDRSAWIPEADVDTIAKTCAIANPDEKRNVKVFNDSGKNIWSDQASMASTKAGSIFNEKTSKEFL